jgi:hypothetical protein
MKAFLSTLALAMGVVLSTLPARAAIVSCSGINAAGYKVLVDDIVPSSGTAASPLMQPLIHRLDANLEQLKVETGLPLTVVRCAKRLPEDPADFRKPLVEDLNARQVVLEIWGTTTSVVDGTERYQEASIGYALIPVRFYEFNASDPPGVFLVPRRARSVSSVDDLVRLVDQAGSLKAYVAVGAGTRLLRTRAYDDARSQLCRAEALLASQRPQSPTADARLLEYVRRLAGQSVTAARQDANYQGPLKLLPIGAGMGCGTTR